MSSLEDAPQWLADFWNISLESAQAIASAFVLLAIILPILIVGKDRAIPAVSVMLFIGCCILVGIAWLPFWVLIGAAAIMAFGVSTMGVRAVTGK